MQSGASNAASELAAPISVREPRARAVTTLLLALAGGVVTQALLWRAEIGASWLVFDVIAVGATFAALSRRRAPRAPAVLVGAAALALGACVLRNGSDWALWVAFPANVALLAALPLLVARDVTFAGFGGAPALALRDLRGVPRAIVDAANVPRDALAGGARRHATGALLGVAIGLPLAMFFTVLLAADHEFGGAIDRAAARSGTAFELAALSLVSACAYLVGYALFARRRDAAAAAEGDPPRAPYRCVESAAPVAAAPPRGPLLRPVTWGVVLGQVALVFGVFVALNLRHIFDADAYVRARGTPTYAAYLHAGFAQLSVATLLAVLLVVFGHRLLRARDAGAPAVPGGPALAAIESVLLALAALTLVSCAERLFVYEQAYGYTYLRLLVGLAQLGTLGLLAVTAVKAVRRGWRGWGPAVATLAVGWLLLAGAFDADAFVARGNVARARAGRPLDYGYLAGLSFDARGVLDDPLVAADAEQAENVRRAWEARAAEQHGAGWRSWRGWR